MLMKQIVLVIQDWRSGRKVYGPQGSRLIRGKGDGRDLLRIRHRFP